MSSSCGVADDASPGSDGSLSLLFQSPTLRYDLSLLCWVAAAEERAARQSVLLSELSERQNLSGVFSRSLLKCVVSVVSELKCQKCLLHTTESNTSVRPKATFVSPLEQLATGTDDERHDHKAHNGVQSCLSPKTIFSKAQDEDSLNQKVLKIERTLARLTRPLSTTVHFGSYSARPTSNPGESAADALVPSARLSLDACVSIIDSLINSHCSPAELSRSSPLKHPYDYDGSTNTTYNNVSGEAFLAVTSRQLHILSILTLLRDALRSVQDAYAYATHGATAAVSLSATVQLDTLLQLPPDTFPLFMSTSSSNNSDSAPAWCTLVRTTSLFTLWTALKDGVVLFACLQRPVADTLWAAVLWMYTASVSSPSASSLTENPDLHHESTTCISPVENKALSKAEDTKLVKESSSFPLSPCTTDLPMEAKQLTSNLLASPLLRQLTNPRRAAAPQHPSPAAVSRIVRRSSPSWIRHDPCQREDAYNERWAYSHYPVRGSYTAPTVYDELFPLPTATSVFTEPHGGSSVRRNVLKSGKAGSLAGHACSLVGDLPPRSERAEVWLHSPGVDFYTGPSRRPQPLH